MFICKNRWIRCMRKWHVNIHVQPSPNAFIYMYVLAESDPFLDLSWPFWWPSPIIQLLAIIKLDYLFNGVSSACREMFYHFHFFQSLFELRFRSFILLFSANLKTFLRPMVLLSVISCSLEEPIPFVYKKNYKELISCTRRKLDLVRPDIIANSFSTTSTRIAPPLSKRSLARWGKMEL